MRTEFHGLTFVTEPGRVFSPRATTEKLVDAALARLGDEPARVADVGTGCGVVAVTLALRPYQLAAERKSLQITWHPPAQPVKAVAMPTQTQQGTTERDFIRDPNYFLGSRLIAIIKSKREACDHTTAYHTTSQTPTQRKPSECSSASIA